MVFLKILPLLIPLLMFLLPIIFSTYLKSAFIKKDKKINELMIICANCGTYAHESLIIKKNGMSFCSSECVKT